MRRFGGMAGIMRSRLLSFQSIDFMISIDAMNLMARAERRWN
jgi:hypothetical protein